jgi:hypothetical protein
MHNVTCLSNGKAKKAFIINGEEKKDVSCIRFFSEVEIKNNYMKNIVKLNDLSEAQTSWLRHDAERDEKKANLFFCF